jgi:hypothetical protein
LVGSWREALDLLLVDTFCICETGLAPEWKHAFVANFFLQGGCQVISHNRPAAASAADPSANSSGIIIGIPSSSPGGLTLPREDEFGRAVAACIPFSSPSTFRIMGLYGPSAAMSQRFVYSEQGIREERALTSFVAEEMDLSFRKG